MKYLRVVVAVLAIVTLIAQCAPRAQAAQVWTTPQKITTSGAKAAGPVVWGGSVYWNDNRSGHNQIYVWDQAHGERMFLDPSSASGILAVYGSKMLLDCYAGGGDSLYLYDQVNGQKLITPTVGENVAIYGDRVVYEDTRSGRDQIYTWDPVNGERQLNPTNYDQRNPAIWGDKIVYEDYRYVEDPYLRYKYPDLWTWDPANGAKYFMDGLTAPAIYKDEIVAFKPGSSVPPYADAQLWKFAPGGGLVASGAKVGAPSGVWGDLVVMGRYSWDPVHGSVQISPVGAGYSLYGRQVAWVQSNGIYSDIYVSTFVPEPGSLMTLATCVGTSILLLARRKRGRSA